MVLETTGLETVDARGRSRHLRGGHSCVASRGGRGRGGRSTSHGDAEADEV